MLFEDDEHKADRVDANRLGTLLFNCGVPLMVLNACQSAAQKEANPYASVAARLIRAGVGSVLAMNYSVLVVAAHKFVQAFYGGLVDGLTIGQAVDRGRRRLLAEEKRHTLTRTNDQGDKIEEIIRLRDWFLPALYQQAADPVVFSVSGYGSMGVKRDALPHSHTPTLSGALPAEPLHGFHGRAWEILKLERAFAERAIVVLHGFGGVGKTALAAEAGRWFQRTGRFPGGAAFVSFEHGGSLQQLCSWVGQAISGDPNFVLGEGDPVARIATLLREKPALVILDNFESVLGREPLMPPEELRAVLDAVWAWATVETLVETLHATSLPSRILITTRDTTFNDQRFAPSKHCAHIELGGLAMADALELAAAVLNDHGIDRATVNRQQLEELMDGLGGHPLSLYLILPQLRHYTAAQITARLAELLPGFTAGAAKERNESLQVSLNYSLTRLGDATCAALPDLAVFQGGAMEIQILAITQIDGELWKTARTELEAAALVTAETLPNINFPFLRFHPTLVPYLTTQLAASRRAELEERYWQAYHQFANYLYKSDTQHPLEARAMAVREMPNLRRALNLALAAGAVDEAVDFADSIARFLNVFGRWRERDAMMKQINNLQLTSDKGITKAEYLRLSQRGDALLQQGHAAEAEQLFRDLLKRLEAGAAYDAAYDHALMMRRLGLCLGAQGRPTQAIEWHRKALQEFERLSATNKSAKQMLGKVDSDVGNYLVALGRFDEAQKAYETAVSIKREVDDQRAVGVTLGQLGTLAMKRGDLNSAAERYNEALNTFRAMGEPQMEAVAWHQLGMVAQEAKQWDEAERCYREAVRIREQIRDLPMLATDFNQLAIVAKGAGRLDDAERWYLRAIELGEQFRYYSEVGKWLSNVAGLYLSQRRLDEAERYARRAVEIKETLDLSAEPWTTYSILAQIAEARGNAEQAAEWRRKEQESYAAYAGAAYQLPQWAPNFIKQVVAAVQGNAEARKYVETELPKMEAGGWTNLVSALRRMLNGETDFEKLRVGLDRRDAYIIRAILAQLAGVQTFEVSETSKVSENTDTPSPAALEQEERAAADAVAQIREQWSGVIQAVIAACKGDADAAKQLAPFLEQMGQKDDWRTLIAVLRRILAGERDALALLRGLDDTDTLIVSDILRGFGSLPLSETTGEGQGDGGAISLEDFIGMVARACKPDAPAGLAEQMHGATRGMAMQPNASPEIKELGRVLNAILSGERSPDLSALPPQFADAVSKLLQDLKQ